jgi:hypothetical protein
VEHLQKRNLASRAVQSLALARCDRKPAQQFDVVP